MSNKVVQLNRIGTVTFSRNKRSKNIKISVKPDKTVMVSFPFFVSGKEVVAFVQKNEDWIKKQQQRFESKKNRIDAGSEIKTKLHTLLFFQGEKNKVVSEGNRIKVFVTNFDAEEVQEYIEELITEIYRYEAKKLLPPRLYQLAGQHGFGYQKVTIRNNKRNWGSCSAKNNISLNLQMMKLPDELIDYILLHELVHTKIKNHGVEFWKRLDQLTGGNARQLAKQVKQFSTYTL
ncbi:MAG TPA: SprT family zinc-dependent metalloprotease [Draconibacterium sp.]|nr:SprT family zinc-dependent metalloprotease [Draconibacterium sp.]